jgi:tetratricopeptide (TPR) repeat protein
MCSPLRTIALPFILLLLLVSGPAAALQFRFLERGPGLPQTTAPAKELPPYEQGLIALDRKALDEAARLFGQAAEQDPRAPAPLLGLAEVARLRKQDAEAERWVRKAAEVAPSNPDSQLAMGRLLFAKRQYAEAEGYLGKAAAGTPGSIAPLLDLGELYLNQMGKPAKAVEAFRKVVEMKPDHAGARYGLGMAHFALRDYPSAITRLNEATRLAPDNALPFISLGQAYAARRSFPEALAAAETATRVQPGLVPALVNHADIAAAAGQPQLAVRRLEEAARLAPKSAQIPLKLGMVQQQAGQWKEATAAYEQALRLDGKLALACNNLAWMAAERKERLDDALRWSQKAVELAPGEPGFKDTLAWVKRARGDQAGAIELLEALAAGGKATAEHLYHLGVVRAEAGRKKEAIEAFRKALKMAPKFPQARDAERRIRQLEGR